MNPLKEIYNVFIISFGQDNRAAEELAFFLDPIRRKEIYEYLFKSIETARDLLLNELYKTPALPGLFMCNILNNSSYIPKTPKTFEPIGHGYHSYTVGPVGLQK